jgi:N-acetylmuramoyl-L-alanine amidase
MAFCGISAELTRTDQQCLLYRPEDTIRENKVRDIRERLRLARLSPEREFISIHLNNYPDTRYSGAQVFYSGNAEASCVLANALQNRLVQTVDPKNVRQVKRAPDTVYLMNNIRTTAVIVECGFLSNPAERDRLKEPEYQRLLALALTGGYLDFKAA